MFVSNIAFDVEVTITMTHQQFKKTTLFLFCRIRKGEQKEKINDVNPPPSFISSTQIGQSRLVNAHQFRKFMLGFDWTKSFRRTWICKNLK